MIIMAILAGDVFSSLTGAAASAVTGGGPFRNVFPPSVRFGSLFTKVPPSSPRPPLSSEVSVRKLPAPLEAWAVKSQVLELISSLQSPVRIITVQLS